MGLLRQRAAAPVPLRSKGNDVRSQACEDRWGFGDSFRHRKSVGAESVQTATLRHNVRFFGSLHVFITAPAFVQFLHPSSVAPRQEHWPAITLALERPWYMVIHTVPCHGKKVSQTSLVGWDSTLLDMLDEIPAVDLCGIARLERRCDQGPSWSFHWVRALWAPSLDEAPSVGPLLLKLDDDPQVRSADLLPVCDAPGRRLLYEAIPHCRTLAAA